MMTRQSNTVSQESRSARSQSEELGFYYWDLLRAPFGPLLDITAGRRASVGILAAGAWVGLLARGGCISECLWSLIRNTPNPNTE